LAGSRERERRRARERHERQREERLVRQRRNRKRAGIGLAVLCVLGLAAGLTAAFAGGGTPTAAKKSSAKASASASPSTTTSAAAIAEPAQHCAYTSTSKGASLPPASPDYKAAYTATINTNLGKIAIDLTNSKATCAVNSFVHLASDNFWNSSQCHRLSTTDGLYMLQCGDPTAKAAEKLSCSSTTLGTGGPGYEFASENLAKAAPSTGTVTYKAGTLAMANSGGSTNGSQFFLVYKNTTLTPDYTPFGTITSGLDILQNVAKAGTSCTFPESGGGIPKDKVIINSVSIKKS